MADGGTSSLILFIAAVAVAAGVAGTMTGVVTEVSSAVDVRSDDVSQNIRADITIISDTGSGAIYDSTNETITLLVKNTGSEPLTPTPDMVDVMVDGEYVKPANVTTVEDDPAEWQPGDVARITLNKSLATGDHRIMVVTHDNKDIVRIHV